jgi:hypothetical protein
LDTKRKLYRNLADGIHRHTHSFAIALVDFDTMEVASGQIVRAGERLFVATAAHVVPAVPNGRLIMLGRHPRKFSAGSPAIVNHAVDGTQGRDVAFLEIEESALEWLGKQFLTFEQLADMGEGNPKRFTALTGFPGQTVGDPVKTGQVVPAYISIGLLPIARADYPTEVEPVPEGDAPPDPARDVFLNYREEDTRRLDTYEKILLPDVKGMSGGGYYDYGKFEEGTLWQPSHLRLYAIQSTWNSREQNSYVRATQIAYWAKLVARHYPELADLIRGSMPRVDDIA